MSYIIVFPLEKFKHYEERKRDNIAAEVSYRLALNAAILAVEFDIPKTGKAVFKYDNRSLNPGYRPGEIQGPSQ